MIETVNLTKRFDDIVAVDHITASIRNGHIFGLVGTNGAGKSTFLRMVCGILKADEGSVTIDGEPVFENVQAKKKFFYISDEQHFFSNATPVEMMQYYKNIYTGFQEERFHHLMKNFELNEKRKINTFSKGMKKQVSVICGICAGTDYLICDETFDGLDPVMRQTVKSLLASDMEQRQLTPIIASHNLRELEDICDHVGLLHKGGILLSKELNEVKSNIHKIQCVVPEDGDVKQLQTLKIMKEEQRGRLYTLTVRGEREEIMTILDECQLVFYELIPLSLEEIFISEMEVIGYDIKKFIY